MSKDVRDPFDPKVLDELEQLLNAAAPAPWRECQADKERGACVCGLIWSIPADEIVAKVFLETEGGEWTDEQQVNHMKLIAALRNDVPSIITALREAWDEKEEHYTNAKKFYNDLQECREQLEAKDKEIERLRYWEPSA